MKNEELRMKKGEDYMATILEYGSDELKTWDDVIGYFELLGGQ